MAVRMVSYDLKEKNKDNASLRAAIEEYENIHLHESLWIIDTSESSMEVLKSLKVHTKEGDQLFVSRLSGWAARNGIKQAHVDWLKSDERSW